MVLLPLEAWGPVLLVLYTGPASEEFLSHSPAVPAKVRKYKGDKMKFPATGVGVERALVQNSGPTLGRASLDTDPGLEIPRAIMARYWVTISLIMAFSLFRNSPLLAKATLAPVFSDHMVLQCGQPIPVWGIASPGEAVTITLGKETLRTVADPAGHWLVRLAARQATDQPATLVITASNTLSVGDILIGEVWICSGQSNMHWPLRLAANGEKEVNSAQLPNLRLLNLRGSPYPSGREFSPQDRENSVPRKYQTGGWAVCTPQTIPEFSAVAFFFGRELYGKMNIPIGLIHNSVGGTPTESWISRSALLADPALRPILSNWPENELISSFCRKRAGMNLAGFTQGLAGGSMCHPYQPGFMYESAIAPLAPFAMRGVIWYQGESNTHNPMLHDRLFSTLVGQWREVWGQGDFPFLFVQLPNLAGAEDWPGFRASQLRALRIPNTGMAVTIDIGDPGDVHPPAKEEVGHRLALLARDIAYGEKIESSGPMLRDIKAAGKDLRLGFSRVTGGLATRDKKDPTGFEVAGIDMKFAPAMARIEANEIAVFSPGIAEPVAVRYGFAPNPRCTVVNGAGLPASPFEAHVK